MKKVILRKHSANRYGTNYLAQMEHSARPYRILIVDDNPDIHEDFKKILTDQLHLEDREELQKIKSQLFEEPTAPPTALLNYKIDSAFHGAEAVRLVKEAVQKEYPYSLIFLDILMPPGINGIETAREIWEQDPFAQIVICTAYSDYSWHSIVKDLGINDNFLILKKPFESIEIRQMAACLTEKWRLGQEAGHKYDRLHGEVIAETTKLKKMFEKFKDKEN